MAITSLRVTYLRFFINCPFGDVSATMFTPTFDAQEARLTCGWCAYTHGSYNASWEHVSSLPLWQAHAQSWQPPCMVQIAPSQEALNPPWPVKLPAKENPWIEHIRQQESLKIVVRMYTGVHQAKSNTLAKSLCKAPLGALDDSAQSTSLQILGRYGPGKPVGIEPPALYHRLLRILFGVDFYECFLGLRPALRISPCPASNP